MTPSPPAVPRVSAPSTGERTSTRPIATSSPCRAARHTGLRADGSGFDNLFLAGDWIDNGLNAGCIEAAVLGGLQAANAVEGRRLDERTSGGYRPTWSAQSCLIASPLDPLAGLRAMADIQRAGLETAAVVVERMLELGRQSARAPFPLHLPAEPVDGQDGDGADAAPDRGREARRLRADARAAARAVG